MMKLRGRLAVICVAAALLLPVGAAAALPQADARQTDLDTLYTTLKEKHPDLFANAPEHVFQTEKDHAALLGQAFVSLWALEAARVVCAQGLLETKTGAFAPLDMLTRAEGATALAKLAA